MKVLKHMSLENNTADKTLIEKQVKKLILRNITKHDNTPATLFTL